MRELLRSRLGRDPLFWVWAAIVLTTVVVAVGSLVRTIDPSAPFDPVLLVGTIAGVLLVVLMTSAVVVLVAAARGELGKLLLWLDAQAIERARARAQLFTRGSAPLRGAAGSGAWGGSGASDGSGTWGGSGAWGGSDGSGTPVESEVSGTPGSSGATGPSRVRHRTGPGDGESWRSDAAMLATFQAEVPVIRSVTLPAGPQVRLSAHVDVASTTVTSVQDAVDVVLQRQEGLMPPPAPPLTPIGVPAALLRRLGSAPRGSVANRLGLVLAGGQGSR